MVTHWDERFDEVCGAVIISVDSEPLEDSSLRFLLYGARSDDPAPLFGRKTFAVVDDPNPRHQPL
jgi:hypothetical protein